MLSGDALQHDPKSIACWCYTCGAEYASISAFWVPGSAEAWCDDLFRSICSLCFEIGLKRVAAAAGKAIFRVAVAFETIISLIVLLLFDVRGKRSRYWWIPFAI